MRIFNNPVTLEYGVIVRVDPDNQIVTVKGSRNIGNDLDVPLTCYANHGVFGGQDASHDGRTPEVGTGVILLAEWSDGPGQHIIAAYIIGFAPMLNIVKGGYGAFRNEVNEPNEVGDWTANTSGKNFLRLSSSGKTRLECTPVNFSERTPKENWCYEVAENRLTDVGGYVELIRYNEFGDGATHTIKATFLKAPPKRAIKSHDDFVELIKAPGNSVVIEELGKININHSILCANAPGLDTGNLVYRFTVMNSGSPVYSKLIDASGNVHEGTVVNGSFSAGVNHTITVGNIFRQVAAFIEFSFGAMSSLASGVGSGIMDFLATRVNFRKM